MIQKKKILFRFVARGTDFCVFFVLCTHGKNDKKSNYIILLAFRLYYIITNCKATIQVYYYYIYVIFRLFFISVLFCLSKENRSILFYLFRGHFFLFIIFWFVLLLAFAFFYFLLFLLLIFSCRSVDEIF